MTSVEVVLPACNESAVLRSSVEQVLARSRDLPGSWRVTIADSGSTDGTDLVVRALADEHDRVGVITVPRAGRGHALKMAWGASDADVLVYMDVDLSTRLEALVPLVAPLLAGHADVAIGTRLHRGAHVERGIKRELISRAYNVLLTWTLDARFSDAQCGFKAVRRDAARRLLPRVQDDEWFFDTELLVLAQRSGLRIHEVPVHWVDDPCSSVRLVRTAYDDVRGIVRLRRGGGARLTTPLPWATSARVDGGFPLP